MPSKSSSSRGGGLLRPAGSGNGGGETGDRIANSRCQYQVGAEIGRGGFGVVFQALNVEVGDFVAVKRFPLSSINAESLGAIEAEIELMKKLNHPNIVKYIDTIRTQEYLHIVLEYMENGSLQHVIKKFGSFSESLTAIYITQVLRGLNYLHEQGVLHRDIKGANILTAKDGQVKLADFGVAMKLSDIQGPDDLDVVGTPYWMAPEIIEMSTPTPACDIWSVGCTIIELITGKPPYYDLPPMAALFRIVQDDYPPIPEGISQALRDFLMQCFQKEPSMRSTATKLLEHPWLQNPSNHLFKTTELLSSKTDKASLDEETQGIVNTIKLFKKDLTTSAARGGDEASVVSDHSGSANSRSVDSKQAASRRAAGAGLSIQTRLRGMESMDDVGDWDLEFADERPGKSMSGDKTPKMGSMPETKPPSSRQSKAILTVEASSDISEFIDGDNTIDSKRVGGNTADAKSIGQKTNRGPTPATAGGAPANLSKYAEKEDDQDTGVALPSDGTVSSQEKRLALELKKRDGLDASEGDGADDFLNNKFDDDDFEHNDGKDLHARRAKEIVKLINDIAADSPLDVALGICADIMKTIEEFPDQREHLINQCGVLPIVNMLDLDIMTGDGVTPPADNRSKREKQLAFTHAIRPMVLRVINYLIEGSSRSQEQLSLVGVIPMVMRLIDYSIMIPFRSEEFDKKFGAEVSLIQPVAIEAAYFVHLLSSTSSLTMQMLIGAGGLSTVVLMTSFASMMALQSNVKALVATAPDLALKLERRVELLAKIEEEFELISIPLQDLKPSSNKLSATTDDARRLVYMGVDCVLQVFSVQSSRNRDFCLLLIKMGLLSNLAVAFDCLTSKFQRLTPESNYQDSNQAPNSGIDARYCLRIATILWKFSRYEVAGHMGKSGLLQVVMKILKSKVLIDSSPKNTYFTKTTQTPAESNSQVFADIMEVLLKCIKNLSMEPTAAALNDIENCGAIEALVDILNGPLRDKLKNYIVPCIFNMCRINKRRQEKAAVHGIIPHLQRLVKEESHLRQFALPILFDLAHTSAVTRAELWKNDGVVFYINMLQEKYWQSLSLISLTVWLQMDTPAVEAILVEPRNLYPLIEFFRSAPHQTISMLHKPLLDMMTKSKALVRALAVSGLYVSALVRRLEGSDAIVLRSLLRMLQLLHQHHPFPRQFVLDFNLFAIVRAFAIDEKQVLVFQMANRLLRDFQASTIS